jgi:hypothetical protein
MAVLKLAAAATEETVKQRLVTAPTAWSRDWRVPNPFRSMRVPQSKPLADEMMLTAD